METKELESEKAKNTFSRLAHDAGALEFQLRQIKGDLEDLYIKMRNASLDYADAKRAETLTHMQEATISEGAT